MLPDATVPPDAGVEGGSSSLSAVIDGIGLFVDCSKSSADQIGGLVYVDFYNPTSSTQTFTLQDAVATLTNTGKTMSQTLNLQWSAANSMPAGQVMPGKADSVLYKAQPGAAAGSDTPCAYCPATNNNVVPTLEVTLKWQVMGSTLTSTLSTTQAGCLNQY
jgi:hypothetical protein